jgi:exopolyphosphatase/guanosine-5'-triphosphate,3'-diphosphate pyrophosphatase
LAISHSQYHKHGAYLLTYSDLPGFSQEEQFQLAFLVRCHRRKLSGDIINELPDESREKLLSLAIILRISVVLNRNRLPEQITGFQIDSENGNIHITFSEGWLEKHPLTEADLATETGYLKGINISLSYE